MAALARIRLDDGEVLGLVEDLNRILEHVDVLREVATGGGGEAGPSVAEGMGTRGAEADHRDPLEAPLAEFAPDFREGFFVVPRLPGLEVDE